MTKTHAEIAHCLLWSLGPDRPLVKLSISDRTDEPFDKYVEWSGSNNFYANFDTDKMKDWRDQYPEPTSSSGKMRFSEPRDDMVQKLWESIPEWFRPSEPMNGMGVPADVEKRLMPAPSDADDS